MNPRVPPGAVGASLAPWGHAAGLLALLLQDTELLDLRETIDFLKKKNSEAQAVIQGALNGTEVAPKGRARGCSCTLGSRELISPRCGVGSPA